MHPDAESLVKRLGLEPHPEGGFYREVFRSDQRLALLRGPRAALTAIHFLLPAGEFSALHRVSSDEVWSFQAGDPLELHLLSEDGTRRSLRLGRDLARGEKPLAAVPAGVWQAALACGERFSWCSCLVAPGFDFADFELADRGALSARLPAQADFVRRFTR